MAHLSSSPLFSFSAPPVLPSSLVCCVHACLYVCVLLRVHVAASRVVAFPGCLLCTRVGGAGSVRGRFGRAHVLAECLHVHQTQEERITRRTRPTKVISSFVLLLAIFHQDRVPGVVGLRCSCWDAGVIGA